MTWSLNELEAETRKALRGAGLSWGMSEDGAKAVRWLAAHGVDPLPALSDVLERRGRDAGIAVTFAMTEIGRWHAEKPICPIALGVALCDHADGLTGRAIVASPVARPLLLIPFVAAAARILGRSLGLDLNGVPIVLDERGDPSCDVAAFDRPDAPEIRCGVAARASPVPGVHPASTRGLAADPQSWAHIAAFVHRTYVPASERSRREGAGAGLIDND